MSHPCPRCGSSSVYRDNRRGFWERYVLMFLGLRPYHCGYCGRRFYNKPSAKGRTEPDSDSGEKAAPV